MKPLLLSIFSVLASTYMSYAIDLQSATQSKTINAQFYSNGGHRGQCIKLLVQNTQNKSTSVEILPGTYLENVDTTEQDIIIVDQQMIVLRPNEQKEILLNGLCCKRARSCPTKGEPFRMKSDLDPRIAGLSRLILDTKEFEYAGQEAMWSLVDKTDPNEIVGEDSSKTMALRKYVAQSLGVAVKPFIWTSYNRPAIVTHNSLSIQSEGNYYVRNVKENDLVTYGIYSATDSAVSAIGENRVVANKWNKHNVIWNIALDDLDMSQKYYFRIHVNGVIQKEWLYYFWS